MGHTVHFWSDIPGKWSRSSESGAEGHAEEEGGLALEVHGLGELELHLHNFAYDSIDVDKADFHTHGGPGSISLGGDDLDFQTLERFRSKGYDQIFNAKAEVEFHGCNVAEGFRGEFFLIRFGQTFLKRNGGYVSGNDSAGFNVTNEAVHPWGDWVTATIAPGGGASLSGHAHLDLSWVADRMADLRVDLEYAEESGSDNHNKDSLARAREAFNEAFRYHTGAFSDPWAKMYNTCLFMEKSRNLLTAYHASGFNVPT
jgi:Domain of unknown function (DUF4347)